MGLFTRQNRLTVSRPQTRALTAAGERVTAKQAEQLRRLIQPWQTKAYRYYDHVPEIKYGAQFYSRMLSPLRLFVGEITDKGEIEEVDDKKITAHLDRIQDPGGGRSNLLGTYGRLMFLGGEGYLTVTHDDDVDAEQWELLSPQELRLQPDGKTYHRLRAPSLMPEEYVDAPDDAPDEAFEPMMGGAGRKEAIVYRIWRRHPVYSALADATMQGVLDVCEELLWLTKAVKNRARSRLASAGILIVNGQISTVSLSGDGADDDVEEDPFLKELTDAMVAAIANEDDPSSVVPIVVRAEGGVDDLSQVMKHIQIVDPTQLYPESGLRREAIERLAIGLDMPPEVLLGIGGANHWSGWMVDEQSWKLHGAPVAQQLVDDLTSAFLRPTLRKEIDGWEKYVIGYDAAEVVNHPDKAKDAKEVHDRGALNGKALREATGFSEDDAPSDEEHREWLGIKLNDSNVAINGEPAQAALPPALGGEGEAPEEDDTVDAGKGKSDVDRTPPEEPKEEEAPPVSASAQLSSALAERILAAADVSVLRSRELAGNRLRNFAKRDDTAFKTLDGVRAGQVATTLGPDTAKTLGAPPARELVKGGGDTILDTLRLWRVDESFADPIADRIEQHAAMTLFDERPAALPRRFENYVRGLEAVTG